MARAAGPPEYAWPYTARPQVGEVMNHALDVHKITRVVPIDPDNESDERGWWPVVAFTEDVRPIVFEFNIN
jgi:hypothetical protein